MSGKNSGKATDRRRFLTLAASGGVAASVFRLSNIVNADSEEREDDSIFIGGDETTTKHASAKQEHQYDIQNNNWYRLDSVIECYGGGKSSDPNYDWVNHFRLLSAGAARRYDPANEQPSEGTWIDTLSKHKLEYTLDGTGNLNLDLGSSGPNDPVAVAGYPSPEYTAMEVAQDGLEAIAEIAITNKLKGIADFALNAYDVYNTISSAEDNETVDFGTSQFVWDYGSSSVSDKRSDICHAVDFSIQLNYGDSTTAFWETNMWDNDLRNYVNWKVDTEAPSEPSTPTETTTTTTSGGGGGGGGGGGDDGGDDGGSGGGGGGDDGDDGDDGGGGGGGCNPNIGCPEPFKYMSQQERERWGLKRVSVAKLQNAGVPTENLAQFSDGTTWYATSPPVGYTVETEAHKE